MKKFSFLILVATFFIASCSKKEEVAPAGADKNVRIEIDFLGDYQNYYLILSGPIMMNSKLSDFYVEPIIKSPANLNWSPQNTNLPADSPDNKKLEGLITFDKLIIESKTPIKYLFLQFSTVLVDADDYYRDGFVPLKAVINVYANDKLEATFNYETSAPGIPDFGFVESIDIK